MPERRPSYPYVEPLPANMTRLDIEESASDLADKWGRNSGASMDEVAKNAGVDVEYSREPNEIMFEVPLGKRPVIWLPRRARKRDDRVVIAMALGHWALHIDETVKANPGCGIQALYHTDSNGARDQAKEFGMALLMPKDEFAETWSNGRSQAASSRFDVPTTITYLRANSLGFGDSV